MFTLELHNWDDERLAVSWSDSALFAVGNEVEIWLGYVGDLHKVMLAEITSLEPEFTADQPPLADRSAATITATGWLGAARPAPSPI